MSFYYPVTHFGDCFLSPVLLFRLCAFLHFQSCYQESCWKVQRNNKIKFEVIQLTYYLSTEEMCQIIMTYPVFCSGCNKLDNMVLAVLSDRVTFLCCCSDSPLISVNISGQAHFPLLTSLDLSGCASLTTGFSELVCYTVSLACRLLCEKLFLFGLRCCLQAQARPKLKLLRLSQCPQVLKINFE